MAEIDLINKSECKFIDISSEIARTYEWSDGYIVRIGNPQWLAISKSGHRILDLKGISHYIPYGWRHLSWAVGIKQPNFVR